MLRIRSIAPIIGATKGPDRYVPLLGRWVELTNSATKVVLVGIQLERLCRGVEDRHLSGLALARCCWALAWFVGGYAVWRVSEINVNYKFCVWLTMVILVTMVNNHEKCHIHIHNNLNCNIKRQQAGAAPGFSAKTNFSNKAST